ncbi:MAG: SAM-dependent DNA methyltransferase, partial [Nanoarchaeota archaeon]|nr:SAM-dependent DNA methyltransferase [Nanoarchaeota archaeon]
MNAQIKHRKRVTDHGEVFTHEREVNAMLDLVKQETERLDSRFLEPACGNGNFLAEVLNRKLKILKERYSKSQHDYERYSVVVISSIYGIDILEDNVEECRNRLFVIFLEKYKK